MPESFLAIFFLSMISSAANFLNPGMLQAQVSEIVFAVNCGGLEYVDSEGIVYQADALFTGGTPHKMTASIAGTADETLCQSERGELSLSG